MDRFAKMFAQMGSPRMEECLLDRNSAIEEFERQYLEMKQMGEKMKYSQRISGGDPVAANHICKMPLDDLCEVKDIRSLKVCELNKGSIIWCTIIRPVYRAAAVWALVEDEAKNVFNVGLYNIISTAATEKQLEEKLLPVGTRLGLKDPYAKVFMNGTAGLRVEHKANVEICVPNAAPQVAEPPTVVLKRSKDVDALKEEGDRLFKIKKFVEAEGKYSEALDAAKIADRVPVALLAGTFANRAGCRLELCNFHGALEDANECLSIQVAHPRGVLRKARALRGLRRYFDALKMLQGFKPHADDKKICSQLRAECDALYRRYVLGLIDQFENEVDDFFGPVELRFTASGRPGLFTTRAVKVNEVLMMERPFAHALEDKKSTMSSWNLNLDERCIETTRHSEEVMVEQIQTRITSSKADAARLSLLTDRSDEFTSVLPDSMDFFRYDDHEGLKCLAETPLTVQRLRSVIRNNGFFMNEECVLFIVSSFIKRGKTGNVHRLVNKDRTFLFVAKEDLPAGTELVTINYN